MRYWRAAPFVLAAGCATAPGGAAGVPGLPASALSALVDPTVRGARLVPGQVDGLAASVDSSGRRRGIVRGLRFLADDRGAVLTARQTIEPPSSTTPLPDRLGGGFLFVVGDAVFRADEWLGPVRPLVRAPYPIEDVVVGLDRVYLRTRARNHIPIDPVTGAPVDLGPWPASPFVGAFVALDAWRAVAVTDALGVVGTKDAGRTWVPLPLPQGAQVLVPVRDDADRGGWVSVDPSVAADALVVMTAAGSRGAPAGGPSAEARCDLVGRSLSVSRLPTCSAVKKEPAPPALPGPRDEARSLRAAVEDGWPLGDGSAVVLRAGTLSRVSLADGSVLAVDRPAVADGLSPCHAVDLAQPERPAAFGFVCAGPAGTTALLAFDRARGQVELVRTFAGSRFVQTSGNGRWLVEGGCAEAAPSPGPVVAYCVGTPSPGAGPASFGFREAPVDADPAAAVTVLADGRVAQVALATPGVSPRLVLYGADGRREVVPVRFLVAESQRRYVDRGLWLRDLQERRPGVLGGWLAVDGTVVGVEVDLHGGLKLGQFVRDFGSPFVAGRYGLGWTRSQRGYETTDGGMTWALFEAPPPLTPSTVRACGPSGCLADGWVRVGWGEARGEPTSTSFATLRSRGELPAPLRLVCEGRGPTPSVGVEAHGLSPVLARGEVLVEAEVAGRDTGAWLGALGHVLAWGPRVGVWTEGGRWAVQWRSPFEGAGSYASTVPSAAPFGDVAAARADLGVGRMGREYSTLIVAEHPSHALLVTRRAGATWEVLALDQGGAPSPVRRFDAEPWGEVKAAARVGDGWLIATQQGSSSAPVTLFRTEPDGARRVADVSRSLAGASSTPVRLAVSTLDETVGVVVEGEPAPDRRVSSRWVIPVRLDSGQTDAPEPLGASDFSDRASVPVCNDSGAAGWTFDADWPSARVQVALAATDEVWTLRQVFGRFRVTSDRACVERLAGSTGERAPARAAGRAEKTLGGGATEPVLPIVAITDAPHPLQCTPAKP